MLDMYKRIKELRLKRGLTQLELANMTGYSERSSIARIERGDVDISQTKIVEFAKALNVSTMYLMDGVDEWQSYDNIISIKTVPVEGTIACGKPIEAIQSYEGSIPVPYGRKPDFALICNGDSMAPLINHGEYVFIRKQPDVEDGQTAAVQIDGEATLKRVFHRPDGLFLVANNPSYSPIDATGDRDVQILGLAIGVYKDLP